MGEIVSLIYGIDCDSWYWQGMVYSLTNGIDMDSWYRPRLIITTYVIDND